MIGRALTGLGVSLAVSMGGWRASALSGPGAIAATVVGTVVIAGVSWPGALTLGTFFLSSSALSPRRSDRRSPPETVRRSRRDARQVLANGGVAALAVLGRARGGELAAHTIAAASLAAAAADTWATEIGRSSSIPPRLILSRRRVPPGVSGGVTRRGMLASVAGAGTVGLVAGGSAALRFGARQGLRIIPAVVVAGVAGAVIDSVLGELVQERRHCPKCGHDTEARMHACGATTLLVGGIPGVDNDIVNLACTVVGASVAAVVARHPID